MTDVTCRTIDEMETLYEGVARRARAELGVTGWGMQVMTLPPAWDGYPDHDHAAGTEEAGQEEVYIPLSGSATLEADDEHFQDAWAASSSSRRPPAASRPSPATPMSAARASTRPTESWSSRSPGTGSRRSPASLTTSSCSRGSGSPTRSPQVACASMAVDVLTEIEIARPCQRGGCVRRRRRQRHAVVREHQVGRVGDAASARGRVPGGVRRRVPRPAPVLHLRDPRATSRASGS